MHFNILNKEQQKIFEQLGFTANLNLYLAGGTALALQLGHRTSVDFDFYTNNHFNKGTMSEIFQQHLNDKTKFKVIRDFADTFEIEFPGGVHLSCFFYNYPLLKRPVIFLGLKIASLEDIAAMKLIAISQRGKRRDFIDSYYLIQKFGLEKILKLTEKKYPHFDIYNGLRGLLYFSDAENDKEVLRIKVLNSAISWPEIKKYIVNEVKKVQSQ